MLLCVVISGCFKRNDFKSNDTFFVNGLSLVVFIFIALVISSVSSQSLTAIERRKATGIIPQIHAVIARSCASVDKFSKSSNRGLRRTRPMTCSSSCLL